MLGIVGFFCVVLFFLWFVGYHVYDYIRDTKGLRRFPAMDWLAPISNLSFMILSAKGFRSSKLYDLHSTGKPVIRIGPNHLSYSDPQAIKDIYGHGTPCTKDDQYRVTSGTHFHLADCVDKQQHAQKRKVLSSAYAVKNLEDWEFKVADKVQRLFDQFDRRCEESEMGGAEVDWRVWSNFFSLDAIADIGLSARLGFIDTASDRCVAMRKDGSTYEVNLRQVLSSNLEVTGDLSWSSRWYDQVMKLAHLFSPHYRRLVNEANCWDDIVNNLATERLQRYRAGEKLDDFFHSLMHNKNGDPHLLEWGEILAETSIMMNAGSQTTAIALANVVYRLICNPDCMARLREELSVLDDDEDTIVPYDKIRHLPYLRACLDESLRLNPPVSHNLPRSTPPGGTTILDDYIPGNTTVSMSAYVVHRNAELFPEPEKFLPERWLGESGKELGPYFIAFTAGARGCIGRNITYLEQYVLLASLVRRYDVELAEPGFRPKVRETMGMTLDRMPVRFRRRRREEVA